MKLNIYSGHGLNH